MEWIEFNKTKPNINSYVLAYCPHAKDGIEIKYLKLVTNYLILDKHKALFPEILGDFILQRVNDDLTNPELSYNNFGTDWGFFYLTPDEIEAWKIENELV